MTTAAVSTGPGRRRFGVGLVATIGRREREVRDTLWLLATMAIVLSPHLLVLPVWCSAAVVGAMAWRAWLTWNGYRLPNRWIPIALTCVAGIAIWLQYRTIFGKDAGVAYVAVLLGLKLLEMRARRDIFVVIFLCLFVMLTALFESQTMAMAGLLVVGLWMLVTAMVSVQFAEHEPRWRVKAGIALRLVAFALPLMAVLFVLFPRVEGPLWGMPTDAFSSKTGISDVMAPGSFGRLSESREMAFRVRFDGRVPTPAERYWRGPVLGDFDGRAWTPLRPQLRAARTVSIDPASAVDYTMTLEASNRTWLFALDTPRPDATGQLMNHAAAPRQRSDLQVITDVPLRDRTQYVARSYTRYRAGVDESRVQLQNWLELPPGFDPRTHAFAASMQRDEDRKESAEGRQLDEPARARRLIDRVLTMIRTERFVYTLEPPELGRESIDEFLFDTRRGYCEHYASAFVFLMRALDIPARVVTGYQGGEINPVDGFLEVRQLDAHAWAEVWIAQQGWIRIDPTAAVAPDRIERGAAEAFGATAGFGASDSLIGSLVRRTRFNWDAIGNAWDEWVLSYNADRQSGLFSGLGIERVDWQSLTIALIVSFGAVLAGIGALTLYRRAKVDPVVRHFERACAMLVRAAMRGPGGQGDRGDDGGDGAGVDVAGAGRRARDDLARRDSEGASAYLARIGDRLSPAVRERARAAFALYEALRYGRPGPDVDESALRSRFVASVGSLKA